MLKKTVYQRTITYKISPARGPKQNKLLLDKSGSNHNRPSSWASRAARYRPRLRRASARARWLPWQGTGTTKRCRLCAQWSPRVVDQLQRQMRALRDRRMIGPLLNLFEPSWFKQTFDPANLHKLAGPTVFVNKLGSQRLRTRPACTSSPGQQLFRTNLVQNTY